MDQPNQIPEELKPLLHQYLKRYQEDPSSRVFAPLAEAYRKAGFLKEAEDIAREGLRVHPHFLGGKVALARTLFDQNRYNEVIDELQSVVMNAPDNLVAQKLLAESYLLLSRNLEALASYKMLLYYSPMDWEASKMVSELETQAYERGEALLKKDLSSEELPAFEVKASQTAIDSDPEVKQHRFVSKVEKLQSLLQRVERYRSRT